MPDKGSFFSEINKLSSTTPANEPGGFSLNPELNSTPSTASVAPEPVAAAPVESTPSVSEPVAAPSTPKANDKTRLNINGSGGSNTSMSFEEPPKSRKKLFTILAVVFALLVVGVGAYVLLVKPNSYMDPRKANTDSANNADNTNQDPSNMYENPINGMLISKDEAKNFQDRKPIAVMVNNHNLARPSLGISSADIVYEVVAEGGITRLMPIFYSKIPEKVGYVRSVRYYFAELAVPYSPHFIHWGGANVPACEKNGTCAKVHDVLVDAYDRIVKLGLPNLDGLSRSQCAESTCVFGRDEARLAAGIPTEHTALVRLPAVYQDAKELRPQESWHKFVPFAQWKFKSDAAQSERGTIGQAVPITYDYWATQPDFSVKWVYDPATNEYTRYQGGVKQTDGLNNQDLKAKTVVIRFTKEYPTGDDKNHMYHDIVGTGDALIFMDGKVVTAKWARVTHDDMDKYTTADGNEVEFNRGQIWVQLVPIGNKVSYEGAPTTTVTPTPTPAQ